MTPPKHIVAVAGLVTNAEGRILMIRGPRRGWEFPGGQVEEGESLIEALGREVFEETGIRVEVGKLVGVYSNLRAHIVICDFLCALVSGETRTSPESLEVEWVAREDVLARITHPAIYARMKDLLDFEGQVVYRAYACETSEARTEFTVHEERIV